MIQKGLETQGCWGQAMLSFRQNGDIEIQSLPMTSAG